MSFLDKIFGKKEAIKPKKEELIIELNNSVSFAEEFYLKEFNEISKEIFSKLAEIKHLIRELDLILNDLEKEKIEEDKGNPKLRRIVLTSKKTLISKMNPLISKLTPVSSNDFIELNTYCINSLKLLESEINSFGRNIAYTGIVLKDSVKKLGEKINELNSVFTELKKLFDSKKQILLLSEIKEEFTELKKKNELNSASVLSETEIKKRNNDLNKKITELQERLDSLKLSPEAAELKSFFEEKSVLIHKKQETKTKLIQLLFPIEKSMKVLSKLSESKNFLLKPEEKSLLEAYLSNPFLALKKDNNALILKKIFSYIQELISEGKISLKEKEKIKKTAVLNELTEYNFDLMFNEFSETEKSLNEIERKISLSEISGKISSLEEEIISLNNSKQNSEKELARQQNNSKKISDEILSLTDSLKEKLSEFSGKIISFKQ